MPINEETKQRVLGNIVHFWYIIVIIGFIVLSLVFWQKYQNTKADLLVYQNSIQLDKTIAEKEKTLSDLQEKEKVFYSQLDKKKKNLLTDINALDIKLKGIKEVPKEQIKNEIFKYNHNDLTNFFRQSGFPNTTSCRR